MKGVAKEIEMGTGLIVPAGFRLVGYGRVDASVVIIGVRHLIVTPHGLRSVGIEFALQNVGKHLYVVASGTVAFAHHGIHIALLFI